MIKPVSLIVGLIAAVAAVAGAIMYFMRSSASRPDAESMAPVMPSSPRDLPVP